MPQIREKKGEAIDRARQRLKGFRRRRQLETPAERSKRKARAAARKKNLTARKASTTLTGNAGKASRTKVTVPASKPGAAAKSQRGMKAAKGVGGTGALQTFADRLTADTVELPPGAAKVLDEHFWDLLL
jgi:ribosomal protein S21